MTLKEQIAADLATTFFNTDEFAETVTVDEGNGNPTRSVAVVIEDDEQLFRIGEMVAETERHVTIHVGRDEDAICGGIALPREGLTLTRADGRKYGWTGEIVEEFSAMRRLRFRYFDLRGVGGQVRGS